MPNYYEELPEGYREVHVIDAKNGLTATLFTICSLIFTVAAFLPFLFIYGTANIELGNRLDWIIPLYVGCGISLVYIVLHELVHGAAYYALTRHKLTFGLTLTCAFCGVPDIYVSRKTALISITAPFLLFSVIFIGAAAILYFVNPVYYFVTAFVFALHFGGCVGDLYGTVLLLFKYREKTLLMRDTGPKQTFYLK